MIIANVPPSRYSEAPRNLPKDMHKLVPSLRQHNPKSLGAEEIQVIDTNIDLTRNELAVKRLRGEALRADMRDHTATETRAAETESEKMLLVKRIIDTGNWASLGFNGHISVGVAMDWNLQRFMEDQFGSSTNPLLGSILILSGSALCAQATTCVEYVRQNWLSAGEQLLDALQTALSDNCHKSTGRFSTIRDATRPGKLD
jgi:hypothetical protein